MKNPLAQALDALGGKKDIDKNIEPKEPIKNIEPKEPAEPVKEPVKSPEPNPEDVHLNNEPKEPKDDLVAFTEDDFYKFASEKLEKPISSMEDLMTTKEIEVEKVVEKEREYFSEFSKKYDEFYKDTNRPIEDFLIVNRDLDSLTPEQKIKESLKLKTSGLSQSELDFLYEKDYGINKEEMSEDQIRLIEIKQKQAASEAHSMLNEFKSKYSIPKENSIASTEKTLQEQQAQIEQGRLEWVNLVNQTNENVKALDIEISIGNEEADLDKLDIKFTHSIPEDARNSVKSIASDNSMSKWIERYQTKEGVNTELLQKDIYIRDNFKSILTDAVEQAVAQEREQVAKRDKNIDFKPQKGVEKKGLSDKAKQDLDILKSKYPDVKFD